MARRLQPECNRAENRAATPATQVELIMKRLIAAAALALVTSAGVLATTAGPASADVLINYVSPAIHLGQSIQVGVWYQQFSGGPEGYWAGVWSVSAHKWIFTRSGDASATPGWTFWNVRLPERGEYRTVYGTPRHPGSGTIRTVFDTRVS